MSGAVMLGKEVIFKMRIKNKLYCDYCGKYMRKIPKKLMKEVMEQKQEGTRLSFIAECSLCKVR
jgi:hypothetical protein